jgi:serine/threonine protein kinase
VRSLQPSDPAEVGPYRPLAELGRGGMGRVLLAAGVNGRLVAVTLVRDQITEQDGFRDRFRREVDAARRVSGAYTAAVVDADPDAPTPWLASVFVPGPTLAEALAATGPLPEEAVLRLAAGLAAALRAIHDAGLVHRDLKPSNVLLAEDGPRVIDFGIARATDSPGGATLTHTGWLVGAPAYMSPEHAEGSESTAASDVFALGCVLATACTGTDLFTGTTAPQVLYQVVHTEPDLSGVPDQLRELIAPCLAKDPSQRPTPARLLELVGTAPLALWITAGCTVMVLAATFLVGLGLLVTAQAHGRADGADQTTSGTPTGSATPSPPPTPTSSGPARPARSTRTTATASTSTGATDQPTRTAPRCRCTPATAAPTSSGPSPPTARCAPSASAWTSPAASPPPARRSSSMPATPPSPSCGLPATDSWSTPASASAWTTRPGPSTTPSSRSGTASATPTSSGNSRSLSAVIMSRIS